MKKVLFLALLLASSLIAGAENRVQTLYMFGFAATFNDSTVYFTDIQQVDSAYVDSKTKFLVERENYSYQLRDYLKKQSWTSPTCITIYAQSRDEAEKKFADLRKKYNTGGRYLIKYIDSSEFRFQAIEPTEVLYITSGDNQVVGGKEKKKKRKDGSKGDRPAPPAGAPQGGGAPMGPPPGDM